MFERAHFILDPSGIYPAPEGWCVIENEAQWLCDIRRLDGQFWIKGKFLCEWTQQWLKAWEMETAIDEVKVSPQAIICQLLSIQLIPEVLTEAEILDLVSKLSAFPKGAEVPRFLAKETGHEEVWLGSPSLSHLAEWLMIEVAERYQFIEQVWRRRVSEASEDNLKSLYLEDDKRALLRKWIGLEDSVSIGLAKFPLEIPVFLVK